MTIGTSTGEVFEDMMDLHAANFAGAGGAIKGGQDEDKPPSEAMTEFNDTMDISHFNESIGAHPEPNPDIIRDDKTGDVTASLITRDPFAMAVAIPNPFGMSELSMARMRKSPANDNKVLPQGGKDPFEIVTPDENYKYMIAQLNQQFPTDKLADLNMELARRRAHVINQNTTIPDDSVFKTYGAWADEAGKRGFMTEDGKSVDAFKAAAEASKDGSTTVIRDGRTNELFVYKNGERINGKPKNMPAELRQNKDDVITAEIGEVGFANRKSRSKFSPASAELSNSANTFLESGGREIELLQQYGLHRGPDGSWIQGPPGKMPTSTTRDRPSLYREGRDYYLSRMETGFTGRLGQGEARRVAEGLNPAQLEKIRSMYTNGQTRRQVAKELGIPINALDYVRKIHGISPQKPE